MNSPLIKKHQSSKKDPIVPPLKLNIPSQHTHHEHKSDTSQKSRGSFYSITKDKFDYTLMRKKEIQKRIDDMLHHYYEKYGRYKF